MSELMELERMAKKIRPKRPYSPVHDDPLKELRLLVQEHATCTRTAVALDNMSSDRTIAATGEVRACRLSNDIRVRLKDDAAAARKRASSLESSMLKELRKVPVYDLFLKNVFGCGTVTASYFVTYIRVHDAGDGKPWAEKLSQLSRFCGMAVIDGHLERPTKGKKLPYCTEMRTRLYQMFIAMRTNAHGDTSKYLKIWADAKHRLLSSERVVDGKIEVRGKWVSAKGVADSYGRHKATAVFLEDLYIIWRAIEGQPVWPSYYAAKLGCYHGGKICVNAPRLLTVDEALELVGYVGRQKREVLQ